HSMGGTLGLILAARYPGQVGRLMVVDMLPQPAGLVGSDAAGIRPLADGLFGLIGGSAMGRQLIESLMGQYGGDARGGPKSDPDVVARATHELAVLDLTPELPRIKAPLRIVYALPPAGGSVDPAAVARRFRAAYADAPTASLTGIANSGHMIMDDQPAQLGAAVKAFLAN
ncbi:MAG TPA: alpha/beta hydrolase, partial [Allosphingosinicella sp.]